MNPWQAGDDDYCKYRQQFEFVRSRASPPSPSHSHENTQFYRSTRANMRRRIFCGCRRTIGYIRFDHTLIC